MQRCFLLSKRIGSEKDLFYSSGHGLTPHTREPRISCSVSDGN